MATTGFYCIAIGWNSLPWWNLTLAEQLCGLEKVTLFRPTPPSPKHFPHTHIGQIHFAPSHSFYVSSFQVCGIPVPRLPWQPVPAGEGWIQAFQRVWSPFPPDAVHQAHPRHAVAPTRVLHRVLQMKSSEGEEERDGRRGGGWEQRCGWRRAGEEREEEGKGVIIAPLSQSLLSVWEPGGGN